MKSLLDGLPSQLQWQTDKADVITYVHASENMPAISKPAGPSEGSRL